MDADSSLVLPSSDELDLAVEVFRMLSDGTRLSLLWCLIDHEMSVGELAETVRKSPASVSQHLAKLRLARLVQTRRDGNTIYYRLDSEHVRQLVLDGVHHAEHQGTTVPAHHADAVISLPDANGAKA
ncbi:metalloregulator ArsR/SmtB family transcription factor [Aeromicrobium sp.]|uniref:ArsR/SmtB family transcription factor n=1 Tax=Aeromicrobium sp. TaxID=1871063 RepID=UPI0019994470|nr:metalloregulator ArsR/SmtB family transcription factor [Aeromicrobium sp.]MBC7632431.1 helix-turn-helix transcriptional regulator [Aeromicrobium sp.]